MYCLCQIRTLGLKKCVDGDENEGEGKTFLASDYKHVRTRGG